MGIKKKALKKIAKKGGIVDALLRRADEPGLDAGYRGGHTAPIDPEYHAPLYEMNKTYPDDIYSAEAMRYYGHGDPKLDRPSFEVINRVRGNPDAPVEIYRAVPEGAPDEILPGDWVTTNLEYAKQHGDMRGDSKILRGTTEAKRLRTDGNSPHEYGYTGALAGLGIGSLLGGNKAEAAPYDHGSIEAPINPMMGKLADYAGKYNRYIDSKPLLGMVAPEAPEALLNKMAYDDDRGYLDYLMASLGMMP